MTMITPSYLGETIEYSSLHACRSTLEDPTHYDYRYLYILVPLAMYGFAAGLSDRRAVIRAVTMALMLASLAQALWYAPGRFQWMLYERNLTRDELGGVATFAREQLPRNATVLVHDVGYMSTATSLHLVDLVGLKTPSSVLVNFDYTWKTCGGGRAAALNQIAMNSGAQYFIVLDGWDRVYWMTSTLRTLGWRLKPLRPGNPAYQVYALTPPTWHLPMIKPLPWMMRLNKGRSQ